MALVTKVTMVSKLLNLIVIVFFVKNESDIGLALSAVTLPMFLGGVWLALHCKRCRGLQINIGFNFFSAMREGMSVFIGLLAPNFYNAIPTIALGTSYPPEQFAKFAVASRLCSVVISIQNILAKSVYPVLARMRESQVGRLVVANLAVSLPPLIYIYFFGEATLTFFLGDGFGSSNEYLTILMIGVVFVGLSNATVKGTFCRRGWTNYIEMCL